MAADLRDWEDLLGREACRLIPADEVLVSPGALAEAYGVGLFALGVHILTCARPAELARLAAWGEAGLVQHWAQYYAPAALPDAVAREQAVANLSQNFDGLRLLDIYLAARLDTVKENSVAALAREGFAELARWRSHPEEPVKTQRRRRDTLAEINAIASADKLRADERDTAALMAWHRLSDFDRGRIESEATGYGLHLREGSLLMPAVAAEVARRVRARSSGQSKRGRPGAILEMADALTAAETERDIRNVWERGTVEAREAIERESGCRLVDWYSGPIVPRQLVKVAKELSGKRGRRPLHIQAHCEAMIRQHYLALTGRETPDWWKWGGPYFDFLAAIDGGYKTSLVQALN